jgi:lysophospholipase L1-like esterase
MFLTLSEFGLRVAFGLGSPPLLQKDSSIGYLFVANQDLRRFGHHVRINQYHQRSGPITALPAAGVDRILVIGDSVTFGGVQVNQNETFPALLEQDLRKDHLPAEVLNASAGGWAIGNERAYAERFGAFGSRVAILEIGSHDLLQETSTGELVGADPNYPEHNPATAVGELLNRYLIPRLLNQEAPSTAEAPSAASVTENDSQFAKNMGEFSKEVALLRQTGASVMVLHAPNRAEVVADGGPFESDYDRYRRSFKEFAAQLHVVVVDLPAEWRGLAEVSKYFRDSVHLTISGNRAVAARLATEIKSLFDN